MVETGALAMDGMIRWIPILPFLAAITHGLSIGLLRANLSVRSVWMISLSGLAVSFALSAMTLFELIGSSRLTSILDSVGPWIGGGVGRRSFSAELTFQFDPLSAVFCVTLTAIALAVYLHLVGQIEDLSPAVHVEGLLEFAVMTGQLCDVGHRVEVRGREYAGSCIGLPEPRVRRLDKLLPRPVAGDGGRQQDDAPHRCKAP